MIPTSAYEVRGVGSSLNLFHPGYCLTILVVAIFPFYFLSNLNLKIIKNKIFSRNLIYIFIVFLIYCLLINFFGDFESLRIEGKGAFHKLSIILIENLDIRFLFTSVIFFLSIIFIYLIFEDKIDLSIIIYFTILSLFTFPFYQEYLDPLFYILIFSFFNIRFKFEDKKNIYLLVLYFLIFSLVSKYYYQITI